jgi:oligosaccharide repeat unit polymerase
MYWILWHRRHGWRRRLHLGYLLLVLALGVGGVFAFSGLRELVGRTNSQDAISYVTQYGGGSIELFDQFLQSPPAPSEVWGKETFRSALSLLGRWFGIKEFVYSWQLEFRSARGLAIGNVYTAFRYWIYDFGYAGWALILTFYAVFYGVFYHRVKYATEYQSFDSALVVYAFLVNGLTMISIQDMLLTQYLNLGTIFMLICIRFFGWLLVERPERRVADAA